METPLKDGAEITVIYYHIVNEVENVLNYTEIPFLQLSEKEPLKTWKNIKFYTINQTVIHVSLLRQLFIRLSKNVLNTR